MAAHSVLRATFTGGSGETLSARLDLPAGQIRAFALFAHCFTCTKDILAAKRISSALAQLGVGVLRFDFTGLGSSEGEFSNTNFSSNIEDLVRAADYLRQAYQAPAILIGHSLGGTAMLAASRQIPEAKAVVTIGAPCDAAHVLQQFGASLQDIKRDGQAQVTLAGRTFTMRRSFIEDALDHALTSTIAELGKALLVMHAPRDQVVGIDNATKIFVAAKHPKSFVSLDDADHLVSEPADAAYAATVIAAWASKYLPEVAADDTAAETVTVRETGEGKFQNIVLSGRHRLLADEPASVGGLDTGPSPYDFLSIALGACTAMTLRIYAEHKKLDLGRVSVGVRHGKVASQHCQDCGEAAVGRTGKIDRFERIITVHSETDPDMRAKLLEIADKCPVHRTLQASSAIVTGLTDHT